MDYLFYLVLLSAFLAVFLLLEGVFLLWSAHKSKEAKQMLSRLKALQQPPSHAVTLLKQNKLSDNPAVEQILKKYHLTSSLHKILQQSGLPWTVERFLIMTFLLTAMILLVLSMFGLSWIIYLPVSGGVATMPLFYVLRTRRKRIQKIQEQLPDALDLIARSLRAGHAFPSGLKIAGEESAEPIAGELRTTSDEINFGISMQQALMNLADRVDSTDVRYFVIAVLIQRETGGNLTELLGNLGALIRARLRLLGLVRVLSAEGRLSGWVLGILPFAVAGMIQIINPGFLKLLWTDPAGLKVLIALAIMMMLGILWMRKIIQIRV